MSEQPVEDGSDFDAQEGVFVDPEDADPGDDTPAVDDAPGEDPPTEEPAEG